jgi:hypothetical protein
MNGMNAEECADKQGEPPIDMPESCAPMMPLPANAPNRQICDRLRFCSTAAAGAATSLMTESSTNQRRSARRAP